MSSSESHTAGPAEAVRPGAEGEAALGPAEMAPGAELIQALLAHAPHAIYLADLSGRIVAVNRRGAEHVGGSPRDLVGTNLRQWFPPETSAARQRRGLEAITTRQPVVFEDQVGDRWFLSTIVPVLDAAGRPTHLAVYGVDITEQRRTSETLRESQRLYGLIAEHAADVVWVLEPRTMKVEYVSPSVERLLGYTPEELQSGSPARLLSRHDRGELLGALARRVEAVRAGDESATTGVAPTELAHADGSTVWVETATTLVRREDGRIDLVAVSRDIRRRRRAENLLREQRDLAVALAAAQGLEPTLALCLETARRVAEMDCGGVYLVDPRSGDVDLAYHRGLSADFVAAVSHFPADSPHARLVHAGEAVYGRYEDLSGDHPSQQEGLEAIAVLPVLHEGRAIGCMNLASHSRAEVPEGCRAAVETIAAQAAAAIVRSRDRADAERLQAQLQLAQRMEAIGTLAGGIAHDFNNLLMAIQGNVSLLLAEGRLGDAAAERLRSIAESVRSGADLTGQLLGFARRGKYEVKPTHLNEVVERSSTMFGRARREIVIQHKLDPALWVVEVDRGQLEQVLLNLYVNAWQAMSAGGTIYLQTSNHRLDEPRVAPFGLPPGRYVRISVTDSGEGMDEATQRRVFEPFFTTKELGRGTGLGLATAYGIVKNHHGFITLYSEPGQGSTFNVYLPATDQTVAAEQGPSSEVPQGTETILLVDDEPIVLAVTKRMLDRLGYEVLATGSGAEALAVFARERTRVALVILDMVMPAMGASEVFAGLRAIDPAVRVLLSSGYSENGQAQTILARGCCGFVQKPFDLQVLALKVRAALAAPRATEAGGRPRPVA